MSKQTRKKSSATGASKRIRRGTETITEKSSKANSGIPASPAKAAAPNRKTSAANSESSHKPAAKALKAAPRKSAPSPLAANAGGLSEGSKAPAFTLPRDGGGSVTLASYAGRRLVIFFYPRASTPGCTREAIDFSRLAPDFAKAGVSLLGVSADAPAAQEKFRDKHGLATPLASDEGHVMLEAYGVWGEKSLYGKKFQGIVRTTVLVEGDGQVSRIWRSVKVDGHAEAVLAAVTAR